MKDFLLFVRVSWKQTKDCRLLFFICFPLAWQGYKDARDANDKSNNSRRKA